MTEVIKNKNGSVIVTSNITDIKMEAMSNLAKAIYQLSLQLGNINTQITITNCEFKNCEVGVETNTK